ncbi:(d)CMP kinase [Aquifex aeolicus]|uniref:Cytidylate kinase n=1 Tax=Aquifex aeolicus (strain VF5) TaxID=224324 RepID=KCY_AQUAE|nr:(d)CMP kinase [Aquifex aeolicus]O67907.1 RecName: Full=Cytidylate kinase; Short=CK; AltName: Full=Cytidine monophosphate kinase; Short=CMP kinase [Aquifex aeolicus VF5]AAC07867.1 cytidylate kinase [Aquifex aeolicus VF5]
MKIAIDGPSASGKSTVAKIISQKLNIPYLETGLVYRTYAYVSLKFKVPIQDIDKLFSLPVKVVPKIGKTEVYIEGKPVNEEDLRSEEVGKRASELGSIPEFRERINKLFKEIINNKQMVVEGRDAGTHIIPEAPVKVFITASPEERAKRRYEQLKELGYEVSFEEILQKILERDKRDMERPKYPFKPAEDAVIIDTTRKSVEEVVEEVLKIIHERSQSAELI